MARPRYYPPAISLELLTHKVLKIYPSHKGSKSLIEALVMEYLKLWRLAISNPEKRIVGTGPIIAVQRVHWLDREGYFHDSMDYFNKYVLMELVWGGIRDVEGTFHTVRAYRELYKEDPPDAWQDITHAYNLGRSQLHLVE